MADAPAPQRLEPAASSRGKRHGKPVPKRRPRLPQPLGLDVAQRLEALILDGTLGAGERLNEVALARSLGVSRGPVREAARALEKTGLVTVIMNRGAFVRSLRLEEAMEIYEINGALFGLAAANAAERATPAEAQALRSLVAAMQAAIARGDREGFFRGNSAFHACILACARNREAEALYGQLTRKLLLLRRRSFEQPAHMAEANAEHAALLEAIAAGDAALARGLAEAHARLGRVRFLDSIGHAAMPPQPATRGAKAHRKEETP
ncbi:GntR family transcriptional regulator [Falsiroseomonas selenitidurans]|uniref:FCD domain-containing protein n=1 Tax=Falsiroseomonas selenitidurans TaxID=2716335 RepID=A0ABX1ECM7_9PROT|nr:FCD domain-containing protein [Falsiroseomonas selenitidurans]NKC33518.1 FCD domain-containing protein [Falsiroseomonas selenitidurans]